MVMVKMIIMHKTLSISVLAIIFTMVVAFTAYMPVSFAGELITAPISKGGINRISAFPYHIKEIIGDKSKYEFLSSGDGSNIFIVPKVKLGDQLELAVITSNGSIYDLLLEVQKDSAPTIHLKALKENHSRYLSYNKTDEQVLKMISHMSSGNYGNYHVQNTHRNIANNLGLRIRQTQVWRFDNLIGAVINIRNLSRNTKSLKENDFKSLFKQTKAISIIGGNILSSWTSSKLLVVAEDVQ